MSDKYIDYGPSSFESLPESSTVPSGEGRAWASINLGAISRNVQTLAKAAGSAEVMAVVKADAYGHGLIPSSRAALQGGATWLGVALLDEAVTLREAGVEAPIFAWMPTPGDQFERCIALGIDLNIGSLWMLNEIASAARSLNRPARVHLKVDTGLSRGGAVATEEWDVLLKAVAAAQTEELIEVVGIWTHLAFADSPFHPTIKKQQEVFVQAIEQAKKFGIRPGMIHAANSAATFALPELHFDMVRPGISVYGISPGSELGSSRSLGLVPAMTLASRFVQVKDLPAGTGVSYGHEYTTQADTNVGLVPLGYADGIPRAASSVGPLLAAGRSRTISGRVCMDQFVVDLDGDPARAGDTVILFGPGDHGEPTAEDWATVTDTIAYEIVTRVGPRVPRRFIGGV